LNLLDFDITAKSTLSQGFFTVTNFSWNNIL
jgi:hypothetical protein